MPISSFNVEIYRQWNRENLLHHITAQFMLWEKGFVKNGNLNHRIAILDFRILENWLGSDTGYFGDLGKFVEIQIFFHFGP